MIHCHWDKDRICENNQCCGMCEYQPADDAEKRVKEMETEVSNLYKRLADNNDAGGEGNE